MPTQVIMEKNITMTPPQIRPCDGRDLEALRQVSIETYDQTFRSLSSPDTMDAYLQEAFSTAKLREELADGNCLFFFLEFDGTIAGYLKLNEAPAQTDVNDPDSLEVQRIYVRGEFQGRGLGRTLMEHAIRSARDRNKKYLWLGVWEKNIAAIAFYTRMGFFQAGTHGFRMGDELQTDLIMKKPLSG